MSSNIYNIADVEGWRLNYDGQEKRIYLLNMSPGEEEQAGIFALPLGQVPDLIRALNQVCHSELPNDSAR